MMIIVKEREEIHMEEKRNFDILYIAMALTIIAQTTVGASFFIGQGLFLVANIIYTCRDFALKRPRADKIKNVSFTAITIGIILARLL